MPEKNLVTYLLSQLYLVLFSISSNKRKYLYFMIKKLVKIKFESPGFKDLFFICINVHMTKYYFY